MPLQGGEGAVGELEVEDPKSDSGGEEHSGCELELVPEPVPLSLGFDDPEGALVDEEPHTPT